MMKASEVVTKLSELIKEHGDLNVLVQGGGGIMKINLNLDTDTTGLDPKYIDLFFQVDAGVGRGRPNW